MEDKLMERITMEQEKGKPCIKGKKVLVEEILEMLASGRTIEDILKQYPDLEKDDIKAALIFAKNVIEELYELGFLLDPKNFLSEEE